MQEAGAMPARKRALPRIPFVTSVQSAVSFLKMVAGTQKPVEERIDRLQTGGIIDMHFDLLMDLYEKRQRRDVLETEFLPEFETGNVSVVGAAIYIEDRYLPDAGLRVALDQIARLYAETAGSEKLTICKN